MRRVAFSVLLPVAGLAGFAALQRAPSTPHVTVIGGAPSRVAVRCDEGHVELGDGLGAYGTKAAEALAFAEVKRGDAVVACVNARGRVEARLAPMGLRTVASRAVKDASPRIVLTLEGSQLGPFGSPDDGVYLVRASGVVHLDAPCPEKLVERNRVVACATETQVRGQGPARVRLQSAGRLEELSTILDLEKAP